MASMRWRRPLPARPSSWLSRGRTRMEEPAVAPYSIAIIGVGKIARDQHLPVIAKNPDFRLAAVISQSGAQVEGVPTFPTAAAAYAALPDLDAVAIATPPSVRHALAREALDAGKHVMLEKPPAP